MKSTRFLVHLLATLLHACINFFPVESFGDPHSQDFQIVEESTNGTEISGVSEYLQRSVGMGVQATYQLLDSHEYLARLLKIEPQSGRLYIEGRVDRESICPQSPSLSSIYLPVEVTCTKHINILASVQHNAQREISVQTIPLRLAILDVNDNAPSWESFRKEENGKPVLETSIVEGDPNNMVLVPSAHDPDTGSNGKITYRLENFNAVGEGDEAKMDFGDVPFKIGGPQNGFLQLTPFQPIDYEKRSVYDLLLVATDGGNPAKVGSAHLRVNVIDVNDESPVFTQQVFSPPGGQGISERTQPGKVILNVTALDEDASERNSRLTYSMVPESERLVGEIFSVHPDGRIILRNWLDYESLEPSRMSSSVAAARESPLSKKNKEFAFYVKATDSAPPPYEKTGTALVVIPIIDDNDERPIISSRFLGPSILSGPGEAGVITENSSVPIRIAYIQARDPDFGGRDRVECSVPDNDNLSLKRINKTTHQLQYDVEDDVPGAHSNDFLLTLETPVDREATKMLRVRIHCVDGANNTADHLINIRVVDINDEAPNFVFPVFYFTVNENIKVPTMEGGANGTSTGYRIGRAIAHDKDQGDNAKVQYSILSHIEIEEPKVKPSIFSSIENGHGGPPAQTSDYFRIDALTGELFALKSFDAEKEKVMSFQVIAVDQPTNGVSHTGTASVKVYIGDINDWSPVFRRVQDDGAPHQSIIQPSIMDDFPSVDSYRFSIRENMPAYSLVGRVGAIDPDVSFWASYTTEYNTSPSADPSRQTLPGVLLQFAHGMPQYIENSLTIHPTSGQIRTVRPLDRETRSNYTFNVIAVDKGPRDQVSRTSTAAVTVIIEDENDNDPVFIYPARQTRKSVETRGADSSPSSSPSFQSAESSGDSDPISYETVSIPAGGGPDGGNGSPTARKLMRIEAQDPDEGPNGEIHYSIKSGNADGPFSLDPVSGSLKLRAHHPLKEIPDYRLEIDACDRGTPRRCAIPARLRMVFERPGGKAIGLAYPSFQDPERFPPLGRYSGGSAASLAGGVDQAYVEQWRGGNYGDAEPQWASHRSKWDDKQRHPWGGEYERQQGTGAYRRSGVNVGEAVIICVAVIFVVFLCAGLVLFFVVKRKSIYLAIGGRNRHKDIEDPNCPDYSAGNYKQESSMTCEGLEPNERASIYRMLPGNHAPGKIVFVDNNFDRQSLAGVPCGDAVALSPMVNGKRTAPSLQDYSLRRGMSASAAVLTNLESVYITGPGVQEASLGTSEYPDVGTRSAFHYPQSMSRDGSLQTAEVGPMVVGTIVGPNGTAQAVNISQSSEYDTVTFQRRCASLKPITGAMPPSHTYRYVRPPYVYTPVVGSTPGRVIHCRGLSEPNNNNISHVQTPYSPHQRRQQYVFADDQHTYHGLDVLAATLQRQRRPHEDCMELASPMVASPQYGHLRQPMSNYTIASPVNRYAALNSRMAPDGEVTSLMEAPNTIKGMRVSYGQMQHLVGHRTGDAGTSEEGASEAFDLKSSPNSLSDIEFKDEGMVGVEEEEVEGDDDEEREEVQEEDGGEEGEVDEEDQESITDPNAKLISSQHNVGGKQIVTSGGRKQQSSTSINRFPNHPESDSQATEEIVIGSEASQPMPPSQSCATYSVHEASFV